MLPSIWFESDFSRLRTLRGLLDVTERYLKKNDRTLDYRPFLLDFVKAHDYFGILFSHGKVAE